MKLQKISQSITPFAGISFVTEEFNNILDQFITGCSANDGIIVRKILEISPEFIQSSYPIFLSMGKLHICYGTGDTPGSFIRRVDCYKPEIINCCSEYRIYSPPSK